MSSKVFQWIMCCALRMKENGLSDMVWALCQADREFLVFFFKYIYDYEGEEIDVYFAEREVSENRYRNDFVFYTSLGKYILESKIHDYSIKAIQYLQNVYYQEDKIRYILAYGDLKLGNNWSIRNEELIHKGKDGEHRFIFKLWTVLAEKLMNSCHPDWKLLGAIIVQTLYQNECKVIHYYKDFGFEEEITLLQKRKEAPCSLETNSTDILNNWEGGSDCGYYIEDDKIWYGSIYTPTVVDGALRVLAITERDFKEIFHNTDNFPLKILKHIIPVGIVNSGEGWVYFKIKNNSSKEQAIEDLKQCLNFYRSDE